MECERTTVGAVTILSPKGTLAQDDAQQFAGVLNETITSSYGRMVLDMAGVSLVDSIGLETLLDATEQLSQSGQILKLCGVNPLIREVLDLTELDSSFEHYADANAAARSYL
jgi:anti-anti-sigma factor